MLNSIAKTLTAGVSCLGLAAAPALAQSPGPFVYTVVVPGGEFGSAAFLAELLATLATAKAFCRATGDSALQVDCLSERLEAAAGIIPEDTDYDEVRSVLQDTSGRLRQLARQNRDPDRRRVTVSSASDPAERTNRPLTPVRASAQAAVNREAARILDDAATVLLRSAETAQDRQTQYAQIAAAIDSNKVLLRS
ncbi:hypothetical protein [Leisingera aquaemixtae]|uniref:Uncharacterized protein n=1 Tax=Leisingera aquaemixtae TaxID=1396826 RepID=A0A0P1H5E7_9RHOB|nr:hypothetical protein [Leisingera aquaemixtae]CUH98108.1 hypothetical protein PHA8399_00216 [Leisingera aquaemixtae]